MLQCLVIKTRTSQHQHHETQADAPARLLIADDHAATRDIIRRILEPTGAIFAEACNGNEAISQYAAFDPDWIIMDISMPEMDGLSATAAIHREHPDARIVIVTQHNSPAMRQRAFDCGACEFLTKDRLTSLPSLLNIA